MSSAPILVDYGQLTAAESALAASQRQITAALADLDADLAPLLATWEGDGKQAYLRQQSKWNTAADELNRTLAAVHATVGEANRRYLAMDQRVAAAGSGLCRRHERAGPAGGARGTAPHPRAVGRPGPAPARPRGRAHPAGRSCAPREPASWSRRRGGPPALGTSARGADVAHFDPPPSGAVFSIVVRAAGRPCAQQQDRRPAGHAGRR